MAALPALLTAQEVADALRVHVTTIYRWASTGVLESLVVGETVRFRRSDVEALLSGERTG
jgi:excisionase family DNA binding protein